MRSTTSAARGRSERRWNVGGLAVVCLALAVLIPMPARAQHYLVHTYSEADGLPSSYIFAVTQDDEDYMWFATRLGIARYDGRNWERFEIPRDVPRSAEAHFEWDDGAHLWVADHRFSGVLHCFNGEMWLSIDGPRELQPGAVITVLRTGFDEGRSTIVLGTGDGRIFRWDEERWHSTRLGDEPIYSLAVSDRRLFAAYQGVLLEIEDDGTDLRARRVGEIEQSVRSIGADGTGGLWLAGSDWLGRWVDGTLQRIDVTREGGLPDAMIFEPDHGDGVYFGNWLALFHYDPQTGVQSLARTNGMIADGATDVHVDREGNTWVSTLRGLSKIAGLLFAGYRSEHGLLENEVASILQLRSGEIVLGHQRGLTVLGDDPRTIELPTLSPRSRVLDLGQDSGGSIWAAVEGQGTVEIRAGDRPHWRDDIPGHPRSLLVDSEGRIWVATAEALYRSSGGSFEQIAFPGELFPWGIRRLFEGVDGSLLVATSRLGLLHFGPQGWRQWQAADGPEANNLFAVLDEGDGQVLVGTSAGLYRTAGDRLIPAEPAVTRPVYFLTRDLDQRLWIGTDNGVMLWDEERLRHFTVLDGLVGRETNRAAGIVDVDGRVWIGTEAGVSVYRPEFERSAAPPPAVEITAVETSGRRLADDTSIELTARDRNVAFHFRAASFTDEARVRFRSWLEGFDDDWSATREIPQRRIEYTNLPPGRYRLHLQASATPGIWSDAAVSVPVTLKAVFWKRGWFAAIFVAFVAGFAVVAHRYLAQRRYARRLELEVEERLEERQEVEEQLARARRLESLGILAGGIAHDFNNLMTSILGNLSLVKFDPRVEAASRRNLANAEAAILRARDLTTQLLTFSRGGAPIRTAASINEVIRESVAFVMSGSNISYELELPDALDVVEIDAGQMSQVVSNLLLNAIESMPDGGSIRISGRNLEHGPAALPAGAYVEIAIQDQGHGIAAEHLERIFDPYFSTKQRGSGLGLATAYSIVKRHDGLLTAESTLGRGATFRILLPASSTPVEAQQEAQPAESRGGGTILVMDDEAAVREVMGELLEEEGFTVTRTARGEEAIESYRAAIEDGRPFDAVILDLTVRGGMGGVETLARLRELDPSVVAIVVSGYSGDPVMAGYAEYGFQGCVMKPFQPADLTRILGELLTASKRRAPSPP